MNIFDFDLIDLFSIDISLFHIDGGIGIGFVVLFLIIGYVIKEYL